jgi:hypothetical protein
MDDVDAQRLGLVVVVVVAICDEWFYSEWFSPCTGNRGCEGYEVSGLSGDQGMRGSLGPHSASKLNEDVDDSY